MSGEETEPFGGVTVHQSMLFASEGSNDGRSLPMYGLMKPPFRPFEISIDTAIVPMIKKIRLHFSLFLITKNNKEIYMGIHVRPEVKTSATWLRKRLSSLFNANSNALSYSKKSL